MGLRIGSRRYREKAQDLFLNGSERVGEGLHEFALLGEQKMAGARAEDTDDLLDNVPANHTGDHTSERG